MTRFAFSSPRPLLEPNSSTGPQLTRPQDTARQFSFLLLPAEIRNKIYRYSLVEAPSADRIEGLAQPPLTCTNVQIRSEALPIYYGENRFQLNIPAPPWTSEEDDWPDFIKMFRVFKAGRSGDRGTGSLRFIQNVMCELHYTAEVGGLWWRLEVFFFANPGQRIDGNGTLELEGVAFDSFCWHDWDSVYQCVREFLAEWTFPGSIMHNSCVHRLINTIVMVAHECPAVTKHVEFGSVGQPDLMDWDDSYWGTDES